MNRIKRYLQQEMNRERLIFLISLITALFVAGESFIPFRTFLFPLLIPALILTLLFFAFTMKRIRARLRGTLGIYLPLALLMLLFLIALQSAPIPVWHFYYELFNMGVILLLIILQLLLISSRDQLLRHRNQFFRILFYLITAIALLALSRFALHLRGLEMPEQLIPGRLNPGTSLTDNPDTFILAPLAAIIGLILFKFRQKTHPLLSLLYHFSFLLIFYTIIWSGSSKGVLVMLLLVTGLLLLRIWFLVHPSRVRNHNLIRNLNIMLLVIGFSGVMGHYLLNMMPGHKKEEWISRMNFDSYHFKSEVTLITFSHIRLFNHQAGLQSWYDHLWGKEAADEMALRDRITFVLTEQENNILGPEPLSLHDQAITSRKEMIRSAWQFFGSFSTRQKITGQGFAYLSTAPVHYSPNYGERPADINSNFIFNILYASGITGLTVLVWLVLMVVRIYWVNRKLLLALFSLFVVTAGLYLLMPNMLFSCPLLLVAIAMPLRYRTAKES